MTSLSRRDFMKSAALGAAALMLPSAARPARAAEGKKPNILFIVADDLGYGDLGCYGQKNIKTPNLDRMAAEGVRFTDCYSGATVCAPSRCTLMTALDNGHSYIRGNANQSLRPQDLTITEVLKQAGYATGVIGKWGLGEDGTDGIPNKKGVDYFFGYLNQKHAHNYYPEYLYRNTEKVKLDNVEAEKNVSKVRKTWSHDLMAQESLQYIERHKDAPFCLFLTWTLPHANNEGSRATGDGEEIPSHGIYENAPWPSPEKGRAAMITRMDKDIGDIFALLKKLGLDENTIVIFTSDNGPHKEGGKGSDPEFHNSNGPLRGIKRDLTEGGIRVPMIVRWPGKIQPGRVSDQIWGFVDFAPTAAELGGTTFPGEIQGISMLPAILGQPQAKQHEYMYWEFYEKGFKQAARVQNCKAIRSGVDGPVELYDLSRDIGEATNVAAQHPEIVAKMEAIFKTARVDNEHWKIPTAQANGGKKKKGARAKAGKAGRNKKQAAAQ
jgi:uncharacterized sulfatase